MDKWAVGEAVARCFCVGFRGVEPSAELVELIGMGVSCVILFTRNFESAEQLAGLCGAIKKLADRPIMICIDQEGGRVSRLREGFAAIPMMREIGRVGDEAVAETAGRVLARQLRAVNIDVNLAPVLDVDTNPANPVIGDRSFGASAELVSRMGTAVIRGLQESGVGACGKHFPGHGDTSQDSHLDLPRLGHGMERLERVELPPFEAAVRAGVGMIMSAHVVFEALDGKYPATMSRAGLDGILRDKMGFEGVVISDDLEMKAIAEHFEIEEVVTRGMNAGIDLFCVCHTPPVQRRAIEGLVSAVERGEVSERRIMEANGRLDRLMERFVRGAGVFDAGELKAAGEWAFAGRFGGGEVGVDPTERGG